MTPGFMGDETKYDTATWRRNTKSPKGQKHIYTRTTVDVFGCGDEDMITELAIEDPKDCGELRKNDRKQTSFEAQGSQSASCT